MFNSTITRDMTYTTVIGYITIEALFSKGFVLIISIINNNILLFFRKNVLEFSKKYKMENEFFSMNYFKINIIPLSW